MCDCLSGLIRNWRRLVCSCLNIAPAKHLIDDGTYLGTATKIAKVQQNIVKLELENNNKRIWVLLIIIRMSAGIFDEQISQLIDAAAWNSACHRLA